MVTIKGGLITLRWTRLAVIPAVGAAIIACSTATPPTLSEPPVPAIRSMPQNNSHLPKILTASWYGPGMEGRTTSSGERFDPNALTAASRTLPLGTVVTVTNPENGRSVMVRINDRGPFVGGRSLDLSRRAAQKLGITQKGVARLKVAH